MQSAPTKTVLIVEDEPLIATALERMLNNDCVVYMAGNVLDARGFIATLDNINAVVMDLVLPDGPDPQAKPISALPLVKEIRQQLPDVTIIVHSAYVESNEGALHAIGIDRIISKALADSLERIHAAIAEVSPRPLSRAVPRADPDGLVDRVRALVIGLERFAPVKERTIVIPKEGAFELIKPLIGFRQDIEERLAEFPFHQNVFLMLKYRHSNRDLSDFIQETLRNAGLRGVRADHSDWNITGNVYNPIAVLYCCKYGIALFDEPEEDQAYSANVAYELGMMHCQRKNCLILRHESLPAMPFDLIKDLHHPYTKDLQIRQIVERWTNQVTKRSV